MNPSRLSAMLLGAAVVCVPAPVATAGDLVYFNETGGAGGSPRELYELDAVSGISTFLANLPGSQRFFGLDVQPSTGTVYGIEPTASALYVVDVTTGTATLAASTGLNVVTSIAFDPTTGVLYGLGRNVTSLYTIDPVTGASTVIGNTGGTVRTGLVCSAAGTLYGFSLSGALYTVDKTNASVTPIGGGGGGIGLLEDATFTSAGELFITDYDGQVYEIDPLSGASTLVASTALGNGLLGIVEVGTCGAATAYCTPGTTTNGCTPTLSGSGTPSASASSGFTVTASGVEGQKQGIVFYGVGGQLAQPWALGSTSFLCVKSPVQRTFVQSSGGTFGACDGMLTMDWNAYVATHPGALGTPFSAGDAVDAQAWFRDPPAPNTTNLSNAIQWTTCP
jgi:hypothetical protein